MRLHAVVDKPGLVTIVDHTFLKLLVGIVFYVEHAKAVYDWRGNSFKLVCGKYIVYSRSVNIDSDVVVKKAAGGAPFQNGIEQSFHAVVLVALYLVQFVKVNHGIL